MAGIYVKGSKNVFISNFKAINCDIALIAEDTHNLNVNGLQTISCTKGALINNCWDSDFKNINIETIAHLPSSQESVLARTVKYFMYL